MAGVVATGLKAVTSAVAMAVEATTTGVVVAVMAVAAVIGALVDGMHLARVPVARWVRKRLR